MVLIRRRLLASVLAAAAALTAGTGARAQAPFIVMASTTSTEQSGLFGHLPELDSMAVAGLLTEMEDRLDIVIEDDEIDGDLLETFGSLLAFAEAKRSGG